jgi:hypothetical protein
MGIGTGIANAIKNTGYNNFITRYRDSIKQKRAGQEQSPTTVAPASFEPYKQNIEAQQKAIADSPYLPEYARARGQVKAGFGTQQEEAKNALNRSIAAQGGTSSGQALRLQSEMGSDLAKAQNESLGQIDIAEAQDRTQRMQRAEELGIKQYQFDAGLKFETDSFGSKMALSWQELGLAQKESVFNQIVALKEAGISAKDTDKMRTIFEGVRVDSDNQYLPGTYSRQEGLGTHYNYI